MIGAAHVCRAIYSLTSRPVCGIVPFTVMPFKFGPVRPKKENTMVTISLYSLSALMTRKGFFMSGGTANGI